MIEINASMAGRDKVRLSGKYVVEVRDCTEIGLLNDGQSELVIFYRDGVAAQHSFIIEVEGGHLVVNQGAKVSPLRIGGYEQVGFQWIARNSGFNPEKRTITAEAIAPVSVPALGSVASPYFDMSIYNRTLFAALGQNPPENFRFNVYERIGPYDGAWGNRGQLVDISSDYSAMLTLTGFGSHAACQITNQSGSSARTFRAWYRGFVGGGA